MPKRASRAPQRQTGWPRASAQLSGLSPTYATRPSNPSLRGHFRVLPGVLDEVAGVDKNQ